MGAFCCHGNQSFDPICPKTLCSLSPTPVMLHIKFDQDWPTGFRDIQVWKCGRRRRRTPTDDGPLVYYKLTLWAFGSGELKTKKVDLPRVVHIKIYMYIASPSQYRPLKRRSGWIGSCIPDYQQWWLECLWYKTLLYCLLVVHVVGTWTAWFALANSVSVHRKIIFLLPEATKSLL